MASNASPEASEVRRRGRQRLIGAVTLVLLLVVFVPMLLDPEPGRTRESPNLAIPSRDTAPALHEPPVAAQPPAGPPAASAAPAPLEAKPAAPMSEGKAPEPATATAAPAAAPPPALKGFAVQVGAFRDEARLRQAREKLTAAGVVHYTEKLEVKSGPITRLRAGPFPTREAAEGAQATLKRSGLEGKVVPLQ